MTLLLHPRWKQPAWRDTASTLRTWLVCVVSLSTAAALMALGLAASPATAEELGGRFIATTHSRLVDTKWEGDTRFGEHETRTYQVLGRLGVPSSGVSAVLLDIAATSSTDEDTFLTAWTGGPRPETSSVRFGEDTVPRSNSVVVIPSASGTFKLYNHAGLTHVNIDVQGYFTTSNGGLAPGGFEPIEPNRVLDTASGIGAPVSEIPVGGDLELQVADVDPLPTNVAAVFANVTISSAETTGGLTLQSSTDTGYSRPAVNYSAGGSDSSGVAIPVGDNGRVRVRNNDPGSSVHVKIDVQGYFSESAGAGGGFTPLSSAHLYNSLESQPLDAGESRNLSIGGRAGIPEFTAAAAMLTIVIKNHTGTGYVSVEGTGWEKPTTANVSFDAAEAGLSIASTSVVRVGHHDEIAVYNESSGRLDFTLITQGWFSFPPAPEEDPADDGTEVGAPEDMAVSQVDASGRVTSTVSPAGCYGKANDPHRSYDTPKYVKGTAQSQCRVGVDRLGATGSIWRQRFWGWQMMGSRNTNSKGPTWGTVKASGWWLGCDTGRKWRTVGNHWSVENGRTYTAETFAFRDYVRC